IEKKRSQDAGGNQGRQVQSQLGEQVLKSCAHGLAKPEDGLENGAHDDQENERSPVFMKKDVVEPAAPNAGKMLLVIDAAAYLSGPLPALRNVLQGGQNGKQGRGVVAEILSQEAIDRIQSGFLGSTDHGNGRT